MTTPTEPSTAGITEAARMLATALALALVLMAVRFDMMGYSWTAYFVPQHLFALLMTSIYDNRTVLGAFSLALVAMLAMRNRPRGQRSVRRAFGAFAFVALTFGIVNHSAIGMLGAPVNYQWLDYSDFLTSLDATEALKANLTVSLGLTVVAVFAVAFGLGWFFRRLMHSPIGRQRVYVVTTFACIAYFPFMTWWMWGNKRYYKQANAMVALVESMLVTEVPSIFTMPTEYGDGDFAVVAERKGKPAPPPRVEGVRNVLFFVLESTAAQYVEGFGGEHPVNPVLKAARQQSRYFTSAYAHAPTTNKSIVALLCSTYPWVSNHAITKSYKQTKLVSLSAVLHERGYRTGYFNGADLRHQKAGRFLKTLSFDVLEDVRDRKSDIEGFVDPDGYDTMNSSDDLATTQSFTKWLDAAPDKPFFGVVWTNGMHYPYYYRGEEVDYGEEKKRGLNRYYNAIRHADRCLGEVLKKLDAHGLRESTLVVVLGDHGEAFGQHRGNWAHASRIYEENVRVPLAFLNPKAFRGGTSDRVCGLIDVAPTVLDVLGIPLPQGWQGQSLLRESKRERLFFFCPWSHMLFGFREGPMKYIYHARENRSVAYDLSKDPEEKKNLMPELPRRTRDDIKRKLAAWVQYQARVMQDWVLPDSAR